MKERPVAIVDRVKSSAPYAAARATKRRFERLAFERGLVDTGERVELSEFGLEDPERVDYDASSWSYLRRAMRRCEVGSADVFVDFGSGKGRVLWQACQFPFARVVGVEISPQLNAVARSNIEGNLGRLRCPNVEIVTADAAEFGVPDDMTFAYMHNPFKGETFRRVMEGIVASLDRNPRRLTLIYANPAMDEMVRRTRRFELIEVLRGARPDVDRRDWVHLYVTS